MLRKHYTEQNDKTYRETALVAAKLVSGSVCRNRKQQKGQSLSQDFSWSQMSRWMAVFSKEKGGFCWVREKL